jgi:hypothetical protein
MKEKPQRERGLSRILQIRLPALTSDVFAPSSAPILEFSFPGVNLACGLREQQLNGLLPNRQTGESRETSMNKIIAAVGFVAALALSSAAAFANTYTIAFTGTVNNVDDTANLIGVNVNQTVSGSISLSTPFNQPTSTFLMSGKTVGTVFNTNGAYSFEGIADFGTGTVGSLLSNSTTSEMIIEADSGAIAIPGTGGAFELGSLQLIFQGPSQNVLASLSSLPPDKAGIDSFLGITGPLGAIGYITVNDVLGNHSDADFFINSVKITGPGIAVAATPIPATLPLFVSALGGIGLFGYRRRQRGLAA